jgi:transmembrane sensor
MLFLVGALGLLRLPDTYSTGVGERRLIVLADGSRTTLNTATEVAVKLTNAQRAVTVKQGEALFEVAKDADRPFVVSVSDAQVVATGTAFVVRATPAVKAMEGAFGVTLLEGEVVVQRSASATLSAPATSVVLKPGDRLRMTRWTRTAPQVPLGASVDRPKGELLAWTRGFAEFDDATLAEAVTEMNRYSRLPIRLSESEALRALRISGVYRTGDNESFARALAAFHGLVVTSRDGGLYLSDK